jgi:hypothetical protein
MLAAVVCVGHVAPGDEAEHHDPSAWLGKWTINAHSPGPNGEPGPNLFGAGAVTCLWQQGQTPRWRGRADGGQLDVIVGMDVGLVGRAERIGAMRTGGQRCFDDPIGMFGFSRSVRFAFRPFGGRARVLRGVGRGAEPKSVPSTK